MNTRPTISDIKALKKIMKETIGFDLQEHKKQLITNRLNKLAKKLNLSADTLYEHIHNISKSSITLDNPLTVHIVNALVTYETFFFREANQIEQLIKLIQYIPFNRNIKIWSAGCSYGQEPYSILMAIHYYLGESYYNRVRLIATDFSDFSLKRVNSGLYSDVEYARCTEGYKHVLKKYTEFDKSVGMYKIKLPNINNVLKTKVHKLIEYIPSMGYFDIIFCKNTMIYMDEQTRDVVIDMFTKHMHETSALFVGMSESLLNKADIFKYNKDKFATYYTLR